MCRSGLHLRILATTLVCIQILFGVTPATRSAEIQVPQAIGDTYVNCSSSGSVQIRENVVVGAGSCWGSVTVPEGVTAIGDSAFANNSDFMSFNITLPQTLTAIGERAFFGANTTSISIPANVTSIGVNAFSTGALQTVNFANGSKLTHLGDKAFYGASGLTSIFIPSGVTSIGPYTFWKANNLASVTFAPGSQLTEIGDYAFYDVAKLSSISVPAGVTRIGASAFSGNYYNMPNFFRSSSLTSVTFAPGSQLTTIGQSAFSGPSKLTSISLPDGLKSIGGRAFSDASGLTSIIIPSGVTTIDGGAFSNASNLASITFAPGSQLTSIGNYAFFGASKLSSLTVPVGVTTIGTSAFDGAGSLSALTFTSGSKLTSIGDRAFFGASKLARVSVPSGVSTIGASAFEGATSLTSLTFASGSKLAKVGDRSFFGASKLTSLSLPSTVTTIGHGAFANLVQLKSLSFGSGSKLTSIGDTAFQNAINLKVISIPNGVKAIGDRAFSFTWISTVFIPASVLEIGHGPFAGATSLSSIKVDSKSKRYYVSNSALFDRVDKELVAFPANSALRTFLVPAGITAIGPDAFYRTKLTSVIVPSDVRSIGGYAFAYSSSISSVSFLSGSRLQSINESTFRQTSKLKGLTIPASVTNIGTDAFWDSNIEKIEFLGFEPNLGIGALGSRASINKKRALVTIAGINCRACTNWFGRVELNYSYNFRIKIGYPVSYNKNGATGGQVAHTSLYESNETVRVPANVGNLTRKCYVFGGWNTRSNGKGKTYAAGTGSFPMNYTSIVLYAKWTKSKSKACKK
jgi:hypothetical protein